MYRTAPLFKARSEQILEQLYSDQKLVCNLFNDH